MRNNITKHKVLKLISKQDIAEKANHNFYDKLDIKKSGMTLDELMKSLKIKNKGDLLFICSPLQVEKEIKPFFLDNENGFIITHKGLGALNSIKYKIANKKIIKKFIGYIVKLLIPVLMALIALTSLLLNFKLIESKVS